MIKFSIKKNFHSNSLLSIVHNLQIKKLEKLLFHKIKRILKMPWFQ